MKQFAGSLLAFGVFFAPIAAQADLWVNVKAPLVVDDKRLPVEGCELMHRTASGDTVRCSNENAGNNWNTLMKGGQVPTWRMLFYNDPKRKAVYPATCTSSFKYDAGNRRWDAETGPRYGGNIGCNQYWQNNNTLDIFIK